MGKAPHNPTFKPFLSYSRVYFSSLKNNSVKSLLSV